MGTLANGPLRIGGEVPDLLRGELLGMILLADTGDTGQILGGGGVSHKLLEDVRRLPLPGGVPITNCTVGGDKELISISVWIFRFSDLFMLIG